MPAPTRGPASRRSHPLRERRLSCVRPSFGSGTRGKGKYRGSLAPGCWAPGWEISRMAEPDTAGSRKSVKCPKLNGNLTLAGSGTDECRLAALGSRLSGLSKASAQEPRAQTPEPRAGKRLMAAVLHLSERLVDEPLVVLFRQVSLDDLRRNHD